MLERLGGQQYLPLGECYFWDPAILWLQAASDVLIALAFLAVSISILLLVRRGKGDVPYRWMFVLFALFIAACAVTRFIEAWSLWEPTHWMPGIFKAMAAVAAIGTVVALPPLLPSVLRTLRSARVSERRRGELEAAHHDLQALFERLKESERARTEVFANVSHELRTPLSLILGPAQAILADPSLPYEWRRSLRTVVRNARLLEKHVSDLLLVAKGETGEVELTPSYAAIDLAELVRRAAANFDALAIQRSMVFEVDASAEVIGEVDSDAIERVVINLLSNAFKFTPDGGVIRCSLAHADGDWVRISVADSGPGIPEAMRDAIFERFRQVDSSSTRSHGGFGLGLAIVRAFVEMHGGSIRVGSAEVGGALFVVELPLFAPPGHAVARTRAIHPIDEEIVTADLKIDLEEVLSSTERTSETATILVVEDNHDMNRFITSTLEPEYRTIAAYDGRSGFVRAAADLPDLIVTDVMMPGMSGQDLLARLRCEESLALIPVLVVSARDDAELRTQMLHDGAQDYLIKPFVAEELRVRVRNLVTAKRARDLLSREVSSQRQDLESLARSVAIHRGDLEAALEATQIARKMAEQASGMKSNLLRMMSHELRTPVTAVQLQLALLERNTAEMTEEQRGALARVHRALRRLLDLIETALEYARIESGRFEIRRSEFSLVEMIEEVIAEFQPHAEMKDIQLSVSMAEPVPPLDTDRRLLRLIAVNLIGNAVKFTQQGGVEVRLKHDGRRHLLVVEDSGPGIPPELHDEVFEPFKQVGDIRWREGAGSGLGLALVKDMVHALGGSIRLDSRGEGSGSVFTVYIPPAEIVAEERSASQALPQ